MVQIKDLEVRQGDVDIVVEVTDKAEVREFEKFGRSGRVCSATAKDETGEIKLTLWNDDVDKINVGDKVHLTNGYVNEFQGEKQLTTGKFGKMEVVGAGEAKEEGAEEAKGESAEEAKGESAEEAKPVEEKTPEPEPVAEEPAKEEKVE